MAFIKQYPLENRIAKNTLEFRFVAWEFLFAIYKSGWNRLTANNNNKTFRQYMSSQFNKTSTNNTTTNKLSKDKQANVSRIPLRSNKSMLDKSKFFKKNQSSNLALNFNNQSYMQVSQDNIKKIVKIKDTIPKLSFDKVTEIYVRL